MATTANVLTVLGDLPICYREINNELGVLCTARAKPKMITPGLEGYHLGLYDEDWANHEATQSGVASYYVRIVPVYDKMADPDGSPLMGTPNTINTTKGTTFDFDPFPDGYGCTGYRVYAGTVAGTDPNYSDDSLRYQGALEGQFNTHFVIGTTWGAYSTAGAGLSSNSSEIPPYASVVEIYQAEGDVNSRVFLGGGKKYDTGYAKVMQADGAPSLAAGSGASSTKTVWDAIADASFRIRIDKEWFDITGIDLTAGAPHADMDAVAATLQDALQQAQPPRLVSGDGAETTVATWNAVTDGSFSMLVDGIVSDATTADFSGASTMADVAAVIQVRLRADVLGSATCRWDSVAERFVIIAYEASGADIVTNGAFAADTDWTKGTGWTIPTPTAQYSQAAPTEVVTNGAFASDTGWTKGTGWSIAGGVAHFTQVGLNPSVYPIYQDTGVDMSSKTYRVSFRMRGAYAVYNIGVLVQLGLNGVGSLYSIGVKWINSADWVDVSWDVAVSAAQAYDTIIFTPINHWYNSQIFDIDNVSILEIAGNEMYQALGNIESKTWQIEYTLAGMDATSRVKVSLQDDSGNVAGSGTVRTADGTYTDIITCNAAQSWQRVYFKDTSYGATTYTVDSVSIKEVSAATPYMSYLSRHTSATGTDISSMMACRGTSDNVQLNRKGKAASEHTVTWDTDHFVIADVNTGSEYRLSFLESATADVGTDISGYGLLDGQDDSLTAVYTPGYTALRSVVGTGVDWGEWAKGMRFRIATEGYRWLVAKKLEDYHLVLDEDYEGDGFNGFQEYVLEPYDDIVFVSNLGNPFRFDIGDRVLLPTADSDGITGINRVGGNIGVFMKHHTWLFNSADITAPKLISNQIGAYNAACVVEFNNGVAMFTGEDFVQVQGGRISSLDPEGRVREVIGRLSTDAPDPHGVYLVADEAKLLMWFMGLDDATIINTAVVYDTIRGNWWLYNVKDVRCSVILRDSQDQAHLVTGSSYDAAHGINAYTWLHDIAYKNDGALGSVVQGVIATDGVGNPSKSAGYLTCATAGSATIGDWNAITNGYFAVTIDDVDLECGPCDFSGVSVIDMDDVATIIQNAIAAAGDASAVVAWSTDHFVITSGTLTNRSDVSFLRPYYPSVGITDISGKTWINGQSDQATQTLSVSQIILTLRDMDDALDPGLATDDDGEEGCYIYICDTNMENGQYLKVVTNTASTVTLTPAPATTPVAGWYWFMGGIVPIWNKWFDFGSPHHKNKVFGVAVAVDPGEGAGGNRLALHGMQDLSSTVRTTRVLPMGGSADTVNSFHLRDKYATQQGLKLLRPNSEHDLKIRSITVTHSPKV